MRTDPYWRQEDENTFFLVIDGEARAEIHPSLNAGEIVQGEVRESHVMPLSRPIIAVVEKRLAIGPVNDVIALNGEPAPGLRAAMVREAAAHAREPNASAHEALTLLGMTASSLDRAEDNLALDGDGRKAREFVRKALQEFESHTQWTAEGYKHAREAHRLLGAPPGSKIADDRQQAAFYCELAIPALEANAERKRHGGKDDPRRSTIERATLRENERNKDRDRDRD